MPLLSTVIWATAILGPLFYALFVVLQQYRKFRQRVEHIDKFPGTPRHWLFGNIHEFPGPTEEGLSWMKEYSDKVPDGLAKFYYGPFKPSVSLYLPNSIKTILRTSEPKPLGIGGYRYVLGWIGEGLLTAGGKKWARNRRLLTPAFHFDILRPYMTINNRSTDVLLKKLERFAERDEFFEAFTHVSLLTLDIILRCAFSYENDCQIRGETHPYVIAVNELQEAVVYRGLRPYLYPDFIFNLTSVGRQFNRNCEFVHEVSNEIIRSRREQLHIIGQSSLAKKRYLDFLDILLTAKDDSGQGLSEQEIRDEVDTFLFEGHDTTASGISWTLYSLARYPEHQKKCQEEIDEILAGRQTTDIEWDDLPKLKYVTMCIKEALRLHTPVPLIERETTRDLTIEGHFLPAGSLVDIQLYLLHHNKLVWEDPDEYRPERFDDENIKRKDNFAFVPFSAGPRNCIGQHFAMHEMKSTIAKILSRFTLTLDPARRVEHRIIVVMKTASGMYMKATPRKPPTAVNTAASE